jgi:hypothetical protein
MSTPKWKLILCSRKFWAALIGVVFVIVKAYNPNFPINADQLTSLVVILVGYIFGTALEEGMSSGRVSVPDNPTGGTSSQKGPME